jgi:hypothetical protein
MSQLDKQVGGDHYKKFKIQPLEFILANGIGFAEGNIIKYTVRNKGNKMENLRKAEHYLAILIEEEEKNQKNPVVSILDAVDENINRFPGSIAGEASRTAPSELG